MTSIRTLNATLLTMAFSLSGTSAYAAPIDIFNAGFETDFTNNYIAAVPTGWTYVDISGDNPGEDIGSFNVPNNSFYPGAAPEGNQMAYLAYNPSGWSGGTTCHPDPLNLDPSVSEIADGCSRSDGSYPIGIEQELSGDRSTLQANSFYELSYVIGNPGSTSSNVYDGFPGYRVELLAGGELLAWDDNSEPVGEGAYRETSLTFETGAAPDFFGQALGIRLINKGALNQPNGISLWFSEVAFDDIQLTVSAVPAPAAAWLFGTALVGLVGFGKRRKLV